MKSTVETATNPPGERVKQPGKASKPGIRLLKPVIFSFQIACDTSRSLLFQILLGDEAQSGGIHTIAEAAGRRAIIEDVAQVGVAVLAANLGAYAEQAAVFPGDNVAGLQGFGKAGPPGAGVILVQGAEQRLARDDIHVNALPVLAALRVICLEIHQNLVYF
jgi:hypothetical protein